MTDSTPAPAPEAAPAAVVVAAPAPAVVTVAAVKPWYKQVSNYVGAAALGGASFIVAHPEVLSLIPGVPGWAASLGLSVLGAGLVAYKETHQATSIGVNTK